MQPLLMLAAALLQQASRSAHVPPALEPAPPEVRPAPPLVVPADPLPVPVALHLGVASLQLKRSLQVVFPKHALYAEIISLEFEQVWLGERLTAFIEQPLVQVDLSTDVPPTEIEPASLAQSENDLSQSCLHKATGSSLLLLLPPQPSIAAAGDNTQTRDRTILTRSELMHFSLSAG
jgi:hypothetical protein